ncbi:hypothetical protein C8J57DRAFT_1319271, partial [Mycena rebaudengoi]
TGSVSSAAFSPDGRRIASGSDDDTVCIWDSETGTPFGHPLMDLPRSSMVASMHKNLAPELHSGNHSHLKDGWVIDSLDHRIMWVPPWLCDTFCLPWNSLVIGPAGVVKLDLTYFVHGTEWERCRSSV